MNTHLLIIDPQNSFCDPKGELYVPGSEKDMYHLTEFIQNHGRNISSITVTLDSHNRIHIAHPVWWVDDANEHPEPFTEITYSDVANGKWKAMDPLYREWTERYMKMIGSHVVWPPHCLIGTWGHAVMDPLLQALNTWADKNANLEFVIKGYAPSTENFSAIQPSVEVPGNPFTHRNDPLLEKLNQADIILVSGEAASHCVAETVKDIVKESVNVAIGEKIVLLKDTMSPVPGFEHLADDFFQTIREKGVRISETGKCFQ